MHQIRISLLSLIIASFAFGQTLSIQGVIRDDTGVSIQGGYNIEFKLYTVETGGSSVWNETQNLTVTNGVYSALLGSINSLVGLNYDIGYWLGIAIDGSEEMTPRTKLTLSPYAVMAGMNGTTNVFPQDGNVGIGTIPPAFKLDMGLNSAQISGVISSWVNDNNHPINLAGGSTFGTFFKGPASAHYMFGIDGNDGSDSYSIVGRVNNTSNYTSIFHVRANGLVGVGTTAPTHKLHVQGKIRNDTGGIYDVWLQGGSAAIGETRNLALLGHKSADVLYVNFDSEYQNGTILGGNVGIGTNSPTDKLSIAGGQIRVYNAEAGAGTLRLGAAWGLPAIYGEHNVQPLAIGSASGKVWFNQCKVGIGTDSPDPGTSLHIKQLTNNAGIALDNTNDHHFWRIADNQSHDLLFDYSNGLYSWISRVNYLFYSGSDRSLKKEITPLRSVLTDVLALQPKEYRYDQPGSESKPKTIGFVAQDIEKLFPQMVQENQGSKGLAYSQFGVLAIAAIKEQQEIIDTLIERIEVLEKQVNE